MDAVGFGFFGAAGAYLLNQQGQLNSILTDSITSGSRISIDPVTGLLHATFGDFAYSRLSGPYSMYASNSMLIYTSGTTSNMVLGSNDLTVYNGLPFTISNANLLIPNCNIGIGVSSPQKNLHIQSTTNECGLRCQSGTGATQTHVYMSAKDSNNSILAYYNSPLIIGRTINGSSLYNNTQNTIVLTTTDQVGVGKSNPAYKLDVSTTFNASNIYENGTLLTSKYTLSNTMSNFGLKTQTDYTSNSLSNVLRNPTSSTLVCDASPGGVYQGLVINNSNINYASGAGVVLMTGGNWASKIYELCSSTGNYLNCDLTSGSNATYCNCFYGRNLNGVCTLGTKSLQLDDPTCGWRLKNGSSFFGNGSNMLISYLSNKNDDTTATDHFEIWQNGKVSIYNNCLNVVGYTSLTSSYAYLNQYGLTGTVTSQTNNYSIIATKRILCEEINVTSDERAKTEIKDFDKELCMKLVNDIEQKHYRMKDDNSVKIGFIAQQLEKVLPNAVYKVPKNNIEDFRVVDYNQITALLVGAIKHLSNEVNELKNEIKELKNKDMIDII